MSLSLILSRVFWTIFKRAKFFGRLSGFYMEHSTLYRDDNYIDEKIIGDEESLLIFGALKEQPWRKLDYFMVISLLRGRR